MTKRIIHHEKVGDQYWTGEFYKWECGCIEVKFYDGAPPFNRKLCGNDHEKADEVPAKCESKLPQKYTTN